jgi:hypothetical protein
VLIFLWCLPKSRLGGPVLFRIGHLGSLGALIGERVNCGQKGILIPSCQFPQVFLAMSGLMGH